MPETMLLEKANTTEGKEYSRVVHMKVPYS